MNVCVCVCVCCVSYSDETTNRAFDPLQECSSSRRRGRERKQEEGSAKAGGSNGAITANESPDSVRRPTFDRGYCR